ncbi:MAG: Rrf2 family transcriptional regulator, partial [Verrucomicrobia bacterium]|nr:Rrf2 family transcriptional regulator [Verrucomicrobiota bacterium]
RCTCPDEEHCGLRMVMLDVRNAISNILDRFTLADVVEVTLRKMKRDNVPLPFAAESIPASSESNGSVVDGAVLGLLSGSSAAE